VANPVRSDGTSLLDEIWNRGALRHQDRTRHPGAVDGNSWMTAGLLTPANGRTVLDTARRATYVP
jgi:hypothetical protein